MACKVSCDRRLVGLAVIALLALWEPLTWLPLDR